MVEENKDIKNAPMKSAPLAYESNGEVAWDKMWDSYCYLAKEGGPPHRDTVLKGRKENNDFDSKNYKDAVIEILRAYKLLVPYKSYEKDSKGWIIVKLYSKNMAAWYADIINSENIECKQYGKEIHLPVNDDYSLEKEIKNLVTVLGKAYHYWKLHKTTTEKLLIISVGGEV